MFIEKASRCVIHHEILLKMLRDLSLFHLEVYLFLITAVANYCKLLGGPTTTQIYSVTIWEARSSGSISLEVSAGLVSSIEFLGESIYCT